MRFRKTAQRGQAGLIGMLITIAIILVLAAMYVPQIAGDHSQPGEAPTPKERANDVACSAYESQMNQASFMYKNDHDDHPPKSLEQLKQYGVNDEMIHADGCYFQIDSTGHVSDVGHGQYVPVNPPASAIYAGRATGFHPDTPSAAPSTNNPGYSQPAPSAPASGYTQPAPNAAPPPPQSGPSGTVGPGGIRIPNIPTADPGLDQ